MVRQTSSLSLHPTRKKCAFLFTVWYCSTKVVWVKTNKLNLDMHCRIISSGNSDHFLKQSSKINICHTITKARQAFSKSKLIKIYPCCNKIYPCSKSVFKKRIWGKFTDSYVLQNVLGGCSDYLVVIMRLPGFK